MANTVLIDGNSLGHAAHNSTKLTVSDGGLQVQAVFGFLKSISVIKRDYPGWNLIVLWDGEALWRKEILPEYKGNRVAKTEEDVARKAAYKAQSPFIRKSMQLLGVRQLLCTSAEADDLAGILSTRISDAGNNVVLITGDKDWIQLVNSRVLWVDPIRDRKVGSGNFFDFTGYRTPAQFLDGKALTGDTSDNIPGVGGIGEKGAPEFIAEFGSVAGFFEMVDSGTLVPKKKAHQGLASPEGRGRFNRNREIMSLLSVPNPPKENMTLIPAKLNREGFQMLCEKLAFASILRDMDEFIAPFEKGIEE